MTSQSVLAFSAQSGEGRRLVVVPESGEQEVDCKRSGIVVSGLVQVGGAPAGEGTVAWSAPDLDMPGRIDTVVSPGGLKQFQVVGAGRPAVRAAVGPDGRFETDELTPGRWLVAWTLKDCAGSW